VTDHLPRPDGERLALKRTEGQGPVVLWVGGFRSDMEGTKALALEAAARERGWAFVRYDHFAHGQSTGEWRKATVGRWCEDACALWIIWSERRDGRWCPSARPWAAGWR